MRLLGYLKRLGPMVLAILLTLVLVAPVLATGPTNDRAHGRVLWARLTGAQEVPGPGDPDGKGMAKITLLPAYGTVCFRIRVRGVTLPAAAAHIHPGERGVAGPVLIPLGAPDASGKVRGCVTDVDPDVIRAIWMNPRSYYVNVHTSDFPDGALRGQLHRNNGRNS